jgi:DNA-binding CsgD family transcriptional regulator
MTDRQILFKIASSYLRYLHDMEPINERRAKLVASLGLLFMVGLGVTDLWSDGPIGSRWGHFSLEVLFLSLGLAGAVWLLLQVFQQSRQLANLKSSLGQQTQDRDAWRQQAQNYLRGLGEAIAKQFAQWKLTETESEVALMLLKGFSTKEIALLQERSERTIRQHAIAVYRKSQCSGRAELAAFFLEDLLLPPIGGQPDPVGV